MTGIERQVQYANGEWSREVEAGPGASAAYNAWSSLTFNHWGDTEQEALSARARDDEETLARYRDNLLCAQEDIDEALARGCDLAMLGTDTVHRVSCPIITRRLDCAALWHEYEPAARSALAEGEHVGVPPSAPTLYTRVELEESRRTRVRCEVCAPDVENWRPTVYPREMRREMRAVSLGPQHFGRDLMIGDDAHEITGAWIVVETRDGTVQVPMDAKIDMRWVDHGPERSSDDERRP